MTASEGHTWELYKEKGVKLFAAEYGGSYKVSKIRPLSQGIRKTCMQDVILLPRLWSHFLSKLKL
jgi:exonuclease 3'-5' domain-containing protein 1